MKRLFLSVFLLFWIGSVCVLFLANLLNPSRSDHAPDSPFQTLEFEKVGRELIRHYDERNRSEFDQLLDQLIDEFTIHVWLLDNEGKNLSRPLPNHIAASVEKFPQRLTPANNPAGPFYLETLGMKNQAGDQYYLIFTFTDDRALVHTPKHILYRYLFVLLAISLASLLIAWKVTRPIRHLQNTTRHFAEGQMQTRAPETIIQRRDSIGDLGREFNYMAERVETLLQSQKRLLRDVSHELRTPLARIQVALTLAEDQCPNAREELSIIEKELVKLDGLIGQLLNLTRLESGLNVLDTQAVDLVKVIKNLIHDVEFEFINSQKKVRLTVPEKLIINADTQTLTSALENILRNGMRYTAENTALEVTLTQEKASHCLLSIRDFGPGVADDQLLRIFDPFHRCDDARHAQSGGYGIGLSIARQVIQLHDGKISAENHPQGGLVVKITLPTDA